MRTITEHKGGLVNDQLAVEATDEPARGAHYHYVVTRTVGDLAGKVCDIQFHKGLVDHTNPANGVTHEILLTIVLDRLRCYQATPAACRENALAVTKLEEALMWLQRRAKERRDRDVDNTYEK